MIETLVHIDQQLFLIINRILSNAFFDGIMPLLRNKYFWAPLYLFLLSYLVLNFRINSIVIMIFAVLTVYLSDGFSSSIIKPIFERVRPCHHLEIKEQMNLLVTCGSGYSFISSHATNHFAIAIFISSVLRNFRWILPAAIVWAGAISYAQVYVGVHFPADVIAGAILGSTIGWLAGKYCYKSVISFNDTSSPS